MPTEFDDVFFDANSAGVITGGTNTCKNLNLTNFSGSFVSGSNTINIY